MKFLSDYFVRQIIKRRKECGVARLELARRAGVADSTIIAIEQGRSQPSMDTFSRLCEVLDMHPTIFFDRFKSSVTPNKGPEPLRRAEGEESKD